ncbi:6671_t:CDS:2, partial [Racocetra persica]
EKRAEKRAENANVEDIPMEKISFKEIADYMTDSIEQNENPINFCIILDENTLSIADINIKLMAKLIVDEIEEGDSYNWITSNQDAHEKENTYEREYIERREKVEFKIVELNRLIDHINKEWSANNLNHVEAIVNNLDRAFTILKDIDKAKNKRLRDTTWSSSKPWTLYL